MIRLAHYSDIHVTVPPLGQSLTALAGKRVMGTLNYYLGGRRSHFAQVEARIGTLLADIDAAGVDHALCTGDVTQMSYAVEFERLSALYGPRLLQPERHTVIPGNHDRYTHGASGERRFELALGALAPEVYPSLKRLSPEVDLICLDVARPNSLLDSSGFIDEAQLQALVALLRSPERAGHFVIVALHYGFFRKGGRPDNPVHGIRNWKALLAVLVDPAHAVDLILHGHIHGAFAFKVSGRRVINAGSATDLAHHPGYNVYAIDPVAKTVAVERRVFQGEAYTTGELLEVPEVAFSADP